MGELTKLTAGILLLCAVIPGRAQKPVETDSNWLIAPGKSFGPIKADTTEADLVRLFGRENVKNEDIELEEHTVAGTVVFPDDPTKRAEILWKDTDQRRFPDRIYVYAYAKKSVWHTQEGMSIGTTLRELERLNGRPFKLSGFAWDYSGQVYSWEGGALDRAFEPEGKAKWLLLVRLSPPDWDDLGVTKEEEDSVIGERGHSSDNPVMQKINPQVKVLVFSFGQE